MFNVLAPLRLSALGASAAGIGATFVVAAGAEACISPAVGHVSDQRGRMYRSASGSRPRRSSRVLHAVQQRGGRRRRGRARGRRARELLGAGDGDAVGRGGVERIGLGYAMALINLAWAAGQVAGAAGGGSLAKATGDGVPFALSAILCAATLGLVLLRPVRIALAR